MEQHKVLNCLKCSFTFILIFLTIGCTFNSPPLRIHQDPSIRQQAPPVVESPAPPQQTIPSKNSTNTLSDAVVRKKLKPSIGVSVANDKTLAGALILKFDSFKGASPAEQSGMQKGDVITWVGACNVTSVSEYFVCVEKFLPKQRVQIAFIRDNAVKQLWVVLGERY